MAETRILRERKKVINYKDDAGEPVGQRKTVADLLGAGRATRTGKPAGRKEKENVKKRERSEEQTEDDADDSSEEPAHRPAAKRVKAPTPAAEDSDVIEDSDGEGNAFVAFARPGKRPPPRQQAKPQGRPTRAAATRAARRISNAAGVDRDEPAAGGNRAGRPTRTAAATANERLRRGAAATKGRGSESEIDDEDDESGNSSDGAARATKAEGSSDDVVMVDDSGSEREEEADGDEDMEDAEEEKPVANRAAARGNRPSRACVARRSARAAAAATKPAKSGRQQNRRSSEDADPWDLSEGDSDDEEDEDSEAETSSGSGDEDEGGRAAAGGSSGDGSAESSGSDVQLVHDDDDEGGSGDGSGSESEEVEDGQKLGKVSREVSNLLKTAQRAAGFKDGKSRGGKADKAKADKGKAATSDKKVVKEDKGEGTVDAKGAGSKKRHGPVERILSYDEKKDMYHVKIEGVSYRHTTYVTRAYLEQHKVLTLRAFHNKPQTLAIDDDWLKAERIIATRTVTRGRQGSARQYLVKWRGLEYTDSTWEYEEDLTSEPDQAAIANFEQRNAPPTRAAGASSAALRKKDFQIPTFCNGRALRDYQEVSVRWMVNNYSQRRNCILGDEMGLGKTAQSISTLQTLRVVGGVRGPFLIVAPLSTLGHWQREVQTWTDMNVVFLAGTGADRAMIVEHEFFRNPGSRKRDRETKFDVLLVSYDNVLRERHLLRSIPWAAAVFDEAHRLKGLNSSTRAAVKEMEIDWLLLLTGTPVQNNMMELYSILSLLDPEEYPSPEDFAARFGGAPGGAPPTVDQIRALQTALAPVLLRRMKEDVEELPQKEEVVVWVELTAFQRAYYRALYEGQIGALLGGNSSKNLPSMRNLAMELRKLCCHPVLCDGLEDDLKEKLEMQRSLEPADAPRQFKCPELELLVRGSGKMVLLHKLLHKLRAEKRRVLIFSQFVIMLNVLEDYCNAEGFPVERIDGTIKGRDRQQAIDRFSAEDTSDENAFVFLLSTRAGGQGITLTAADTCIIYDSDWNPQNDLQAMARCHRIGQKKEVTVYRLISRDTYEMALFNSASRKYGLDEAILGFSGGSDPESDAARITELLRHGAHGLLADMEAGARQGEAFASEDINQILEGRTEKRQIGSRAGNTFSVATFAADDGRRRKGSREGSAGADDEDKDYWRTLMPEAVAAHEAAKAAADCPVILGPRKRKQVNYNLNHKRYNPKLHSDSESDSESGSDDKDAGSGQDAQDGSTGEGQEGEGSDPGGKQGKPRSRKKRAGSSEAEAPEAAADGGRQEAGAGPAGEKFKGRRRPPAGTWTKTDLKLLEDRLVALGPDRWDDLFQQMQPCKRTREEVEAAGRAMWALYDIAAGVAAERKAARQRASAEALANEIAAMMDPLDDEGDFTVAARTAAGLGGVAPVGAGAAATAAAAEAANVPDEYEEKLAKLIRDKVPEALHFALSGSTALRRLLQQSTENLRHGQLMQELSRMMRPTLQQTVAGEASASGGYNGLHACYMPPPSGAFMSWWSRADDEALLVAAAQVGYLPGVPRRTVEHALRQQPLAGRVARKPEPEEGAAPGGSAGDAAETAAAEAAAAKPEVEKPAGEKREHVKGDQAMAEAGEKLAPSAPPPRAPGPNGPLLLSSDEWRVMVSTISRRLLKVINASLELHRRINAAGGKQPLAVAKPSRPSGPLPPPREAGPAAAAAGTTHPTHGAAAAVAAAAKALAAPQPANVAKAPATAAAAAPKGPTPVTVAGAVNMAVAAVTALAQRLSGSPLRGPAAKPTQHDRTQPTFPSGAGPSAPGQQQHQQRAPTLGPNQRTTGDAAQRQQPDKAAVGAAGAAAPAAAAGAGKSAGLKKQSTLPFARLGGSAAKTAKPDNANKSAVGTALKTIAPAAAAPGSAEKPIALDDSDE